MNLFGSFSKVRKGILGISMLLVFLVSCQSTTPPAQTSGGGGDNGSVPGALIDEVEESNGNSNEKKSSPTDIPAPTPTLAHIAFPSPNDKKVESTAVLFLWDDSGSVLDENRKGCKGNNVEMRYNVPYYFLTLMRHVVQNEDYRRLLHLGTAHFSYKEQPGGKNIPYKATFDGGVLSLEQLEPGIPKQFWDEVIIDKDLAGSDTDYKTALKEALDDLHQVDVNRRVLVLLTDGFLGGTNQETLTEALKEIAVPDTADPSTDVYVALLCPDKLDEKTMKTVWSDLNGYNNITIMDNGHPEDWISTLWEDVFSGYFSSDLFQGGWLDYNNPQASVEIPGYASRLNFNYLPYREGTIDLQNYGTISPNIGGSPFRRKIDVQPNEACGYQSKRISALDGAAGFYWVSYDVPEWNVGVTVKPPTLVNNNSGEPVHIWAYIKDVPPAHFICYRPTVYVPGGSIERLPCGSSGRILETFCFEGAGLYAHWEWNPGFTTGRKDTVEVSVQRGNNDENEKQETADTEVVAQFKALVSGPIQDSSESSKKKMNVGARCKKDGCLDILSYTVTFDYAATSPQIHAKSNTDLSKINDGLADPDNEMFITQENGQNYQCPERTNGVIDIQLQPRPNIDYPLVYWTDKKGDLQATYTISIYRYVKDWCGVKTIFFNWNDEEGVVRITYQIDLDSKSIKPIEP